MGFLLLAVVISAELVHLAVHYIFQTHKRAEGSCARR